MNELVTPPIPLFKYTCLAAVEDLCVHRRSRWAAPRSFNDPFDMQRDLFVRASAEEIAEAMSDAWEEVVYGDRPRPTSDPLGFFAIVTAVVQRMGTSREEFRAQNRELLVDQYGGLVEGLRKELEYWRDYAARARVFSLSANQSHLAMWAHYADDHAGAVIEFRGVFELDSSWLAATPVAYRDRLPEWMTATDFAERSASGNVAGDTMLRDQLYTKSSDWSYEREWRVYKLLEEDDGEAHWHNTVLEPEVQGVYFGCRAPATEVDRLRAMLRANFPSCAVFKGRKSETEYEIVFDQVDGPS